MFVNLLVNKNLLKKNILVNKLKNQLRSTVKTIERR